MKFKNIRNLRLSVIRRLKKQGFSTKSIVDAKLNYAKLNCAKLNYAELNDAELNYAELNDAELNGAKLNYAKLNNAELNNAELIRVDGLDFSVIITKTHVCIGCKRFSLEKFKKIDLNKYSDYSKSFNQYKIVLFFIESLEKLWGVDEGKT